MSKGAVFFVVIRDMLATNLTNFHQTIFGVLFILVSRVFNQERKKNEWALTTVTKCTLGANG